MADELIELSKKRHEVLIRDGRAAQAEAAKEMAAIEIARRIPAAMQVIDECMQSEDGNIRLRAVEMILSRTVPKVGTVLDKTEEDVKQTKDQERIVDELEELLRKNKS